MCSGAEGKSELTYHQALSITSHPFSTNCASNANVGVYMAIRDTKPKCDLRWILRILSDTGSNTELADVALSLRRTVTPRL